LELLTADLGVYEAVGVLETQTLIENTLEDFNVPVKVVHVESGPTVTQFGVAPLYLERAGQRRKVRVNRIVSLADDLALALAVPAVRIEAPVPGRPYVGIEVPNAEKVTVSLRGVIESPAYQKEGGRLPLPLGRNTAGAGVVMDLVRAPHMLIAGSTGSGKSVCINTIITGLLMRFGPESLRFVMVDPKMVELPGYNGIPHMIGKVITEMDQVMGALTWMLLQMDDRYQAFKAVGVRNIDSYNALAGKKPKKGEEPVTPLPYIVLVIDELADLMMTAADDIERQICRLAQMARATGIHLIIATQRPSTDVVTGLIKANFPTRIAFSVTSQIDSRVILDSVGAERLLGRGDMLLMRPDVAKLQRVQGCLVTDPEINRIVAFWKAQVPADAPTRVAPWTGLLDQMDDDDGLIQDAVDVLRDLESCSTSMLQRKLKIGYPKAARLMEDLEKKGIVGPDMGGGQGREVLLKKDGDEEPEEGEAEGELF
jgi:S-DNA-T family DNA segregation ATPase FtsK/SpoIIIE